ncbi:MAG: MMPL family transporter [Myxococcota bacterium]|nr:MMPL family transporter [Myxococcota bacterium]
MTRIESALARGLGRWVAFVRRHASPVAAGLLVLTLGAGVYAVLNLGINSDNVRMIADDVPSQRAQQEFSRLFPILDNALIVVIDGDAPALAREAADRLAARLRADDEHFVDVFEPGGGAFFERNGLLYRSAEEVEEMSDNLVRAQPLIAELERDPSIANLASLVTLGLERARAEGDDTEDWARVLDRVGQATVAVYAEVPVHVSWEDFLLRGSALEINPRRVLMVEPVLDFDSLLPAGEPLSRIRAAVEELGLGSGSGVRVRITGNPALNHEEMLGLAWDIGVAGIFCFALVAYVLYRALRSWSLVTAALGTLLSGLLWTAAFAAAAVGHVNLVSICFAILFIGLGVDFAIHLGMHYAEALRAGATPREAAQRATSQVGTPLVICTVSTAIGFFSFVPTDYLGVAELGLIAGAGMFVILILTMTLFPALLASWLRVDPTTMRVPRGVQVGWMRGLERHPGAVCAVAAGLAVAAGTLLPGLGFDSNVIRMRNPDTESVQVMEELMADSLTNPWYVDAIAPDFAAARELATALDALPQVGQAVALDAYVPAEQDEKLEILGDLALLADFPDPGPTRSLPVAEQVAALRDLQELLAREGVGYGDSPTARSASMLRSHIERFLERAEREERPEEALDELGRILLSSLPEQIDGLRAALAVGPVGAEDLPASLARRMLAEDGTARVQVFPTEDLIDLEAMTTFADEVRTLAPEATGIPINLVEFGRATMRSLAEATALALGTISLLLLLLWQRPGPAAAALAPLVLAAMLTGALMVLLGRSFDFANVVVLPLLLGVGIDSGIHLVQRAREGEPGEPLLGTVTARAVFYSALTTIASFGSLAFSAHRGIAGMGLLLVLALLMGLACNLLVLPALLSLRHRG